MQLEFIRNSCDLYDDGCENEAIRIAVSVTVLLIKTRVNTPIVEHMLKKEKIYGLKIYSTNTTDMMKPIAPETIKEMSKGRRFKLNPLRTESSPASSFFFLLGNGNSPYLGYSDHEFVSPGYMTLDCYLKQVVLCDIDEKRKPYPLTRKDLVLIARNKDGGAHVDGNLNPVEYVKHKLGFDIATGLDGEKITTADRHLVALRQIGYEILNSGLERQINSMLESC